MSPDASGARIRSWRPTAPLSLTQTLGVLTRGARHTTARAVDGAVWVATRADGSPVTARFARTGRGTPLERPVEVRAWGLGAEAFLEEAPDWTGEGDDWSALEDGPLREALPPALRRARREHPGMRLPRTGRLFEALVAAVLEQRVTSREAVGQQRWLARRAGDPAPGPAPAGMRVPPSPEQIRAVPSWAWHRAGVDPARTRTLLGLSQRAAALDRWDRAPADHRLDAALASLPGIGPWTRAEVLQVTHGHPDAVSVLDYHLAHRVTEFFDGVRGDDARMLELLAPWAGHRQRVVRLIAATGWAPQPKGPRLAPEDHRRR